MAIIAYIATCCLRGMFSKKISRKKILEMMMETKKLWKNKSRTKELN